MGLNSFDNRKSVRRQGLLRRLVPEKELGGAQRGPQSPQLFATAERRDADSLEIVVCQPGRQLNVVSEPGS
jgi:hypothetical protein